MIKTIESKVVSCIKQAYKDENNRLIDSRYIDCIFDDCEYRDNGYKEIESEYMNGFYAIEGGTVSVDIEHLAGIRSKFHNVQFGECSLVPNNITCLITGNYYDSMKVTMLIVPNQILKDNNYKVGECRQYVHD